MNLTYNFLMLFLKTKNFQSSFYENWNLSSKSNDVKIDLQLEFKINMYFLQLNINF